jgi:GNAT superfamily N-acetyltransferase
MLTDPPSHWIQAAKSSQRAEALLLLLCETPLADRTRQLAALLQAARKGVVSLEHLLVAGEGDRVEGAVWANALEGGLGAIWPPQFRDDSPLLLSDQHDDICRALILAAEQRVEQAAEISLWQASLDVDSEVSQQRLMASSYRRLAVLAQLIAVLSAGREIGSCEPLRFVRYQTEDFARLCNLIDLTYVATLDCPELDGLRTTAESVTGYRAIGISAQEYWYFARHANRDVGCLLLAEHEDHQFELVYMGLVPPCRGQRWGKLLVNEALQVARDRGATALTTSVDQRNRPAMKTYEQAGFSTWGCRQIMVKPCR